VKPLTNPSYGNKIAMTHKRIKIIVLLIVFGGCIGVTKTYPEKKFFLIELENQASNLSPQKGSSFKIRKFSISQRFEGKEFVYRKDNVNFESDYYNSFFISPSSNLREEFTKSLLAQKIFEWDAGQNSRIDATHFMEVNISELYGDFRGNPKAVLSLDLFVYTEKDSLPVVIFKKSYQSAVEIQRKEAGDLVAGWNEGFNQITLEIGKDLKDNIVVK
jgi:cholesterol transport system auxiliary component